MVEYQDQRDTKMQKFLILISIIFICLSSCDLSSPKDVNETEIKNIFAEIKSAFNFADIDGIMQHYHPAFLHNSNNWDDEYTVWQIRLNDFAVFDYEDLQIDFNNNFAMVSFTLYLGENIFQEPTSENGDLSYFYQSFDGWKLCGNEFVEELLK